MAVQDVQESIPLLQQQGPASHIVLSLQASNGLQQEGKGGGGGIPLRHGRPLLIFDARVK